MSGSPVVDRIRGDIDRLHDTIANLATRDEVATIETIVQELAETLSKPRPVQDMAVLVGSVASLQRQVHRLSDEVIEGIPQRIAAEVEGLKHQLGVAAAGGVDRSLVAALETELAAMRQSLAQMVEPQRIERLSEEVSVLARHMAEIRLNQVGRSDFAKLKGTLEEVRAHLQEERQARDAHQVPQRLASLSERLDLLLSRGPTLDALAPVSEQVASLDARLAPIPDQLARLSEQLGTLATGPVPGVAPLTEQLTTIADRLGALESRHEAPSLAPVIDQLTAVAERLSSLAPDRNQVTEHLSGLTERLSALASQSADPSPRLVAILEQVSGQVEAMSHDLGAPRKELLDRLDRLEDSVRQIGSEASTASLELMLQGFGEKLQQATPATVSLDGLEAQMAGLTVQLERAAAAPPLQQLMNETLAQVKELREDATAIAERAAKAVLKDAKTGPQPHSPVDSDPLKQGLAELKALQAQADRKTQHTLKAVHNALETLVLRFPSQGPMVSRFSDPSPTPAHAAIDPFPAMRLEAAVRKLHKAAIAHAEEITATPVETAPGSATQVEEMLLEPGAPRPQVAPSTASFTASVDDEPGTVRANFIAAARRATQGNAPEQPALRADDVGDLDRAEQSGPEPSLAHQSFLERIRQTFDTHRRPLLLGLALLILTAGTFEMVATVRAPLDDSLPPLTATEAPAPAASTEQPSDTGKASEATPPAPATTGSLFQPSVTEARPVPSEAFTAVPKRVPGVTGLGELPPALPANLREAALAGDPAAVYEVASRAFDGRGVPRDPALAARLFEGAAKAGFIPAQARIGNLYEKGQGVARDLVAARSWYERAGISGNARAMHNLAVLFAEGIDGKPDFASAQRWFQDAAETGLRDSQFNLGVLLARGLGTQQDFAQSYKWFALAAAQGDEEAARKRDEIAARLSAPDLAAAKSLVERWRARALDPAANEVSVPPQGWSSMKTPNGRG